MESVTPIWDEMVKEYTDKGEMPELTGDTSGTE